MNEYGQRLYDYFCRHDPESVAALRDPESHFATLGRQVSVRIATLMNCAVNELDLHETCVDHRGSVSAMQGEIESMVLAEMVFAGLAPKPPRKQGDHDTSAHFRDHIGRLATYFSDGGLGL